jgi:hypothetical protein
MIEGLQGFNCINQYSPIEESHSDDSLSRLVNLVASKYNELRLERWSNNENEQVHKVSEFASGHFDGKKLF